MKENMTPIAEALWVAANVHLLTGIDELDDEENEDTLGSTFTCDCIVYATDQGAVEFEVVMRFLISLGFPKDAEHRFDLFSDYRQGEERQNERYHWLMLAHHIAMEEGI